MIPTQLVPDLTAHLAATYHATVVGPDDVEAVIARGVLSVVASLVPEARSIIDTLETAAGRISVTLPTLKGCVIILAPAAIADPVTHAATLAHECQHAQQRLAVGATEIAWDYLASAELRARAEADAYAVGMAVTWFFTGSLPKLDDAIASLEGGPYHLGADDVSLARGDLASHHATMEGGRCPPLTVAVEVLRWLRAHYPAAVLATVEALP